MRKNLFIVLLFIFSVSSCRKSSISVEPLASFSIDGDSSGNFTTATYSGFTLMNKSVNAASYIWDVGDGRTSGDKDLAISYPKSGTYKVTLTAINTDGKKSVVSKTIKVLDRVLKQIVIPSLNFKSALGFFNATYPSNTANVWVEIQQAAPGSWDYPILSTGAFDVPVVFKSPVASNVNSNSVPIVLNIAEKFVIDFPTLVGTQPAGMGYGFNLYAQDATGTYLLTSSYGSGIGNSAIGDMRHNTFTITTGFEGSEIILNCDYE
jgi:PKD repeat protein